MTYAFDLWLEFEHCGPHEDDNSENDFFNMQITLSSGQKYALNVWTFKYLVRAVQECRESGEHLHGSYLPPPDLFVERLDRMSLEEVVADLIAHGEMKDEWKVPRDS